MKRKPSIRPCIFRKCTDKRGSWSVWSYRSAFDSGDLSSYMENTVPGMIGSLEHCNAPFNEWKGAMLSFPSSHASLSFSGLLILSLYMSRKFTPSFTSCANIMGTLAFKVRTFI